MKKLTTAILSLLALTLTGCGDKMKPNPNLIHSGYRWDVVRLNDTIVVCTPGLNASSKLTPAVINLNAPDCPCRESSTQSLCTAKKGDTDATV